MRGGILGVPRVSLRVSGAHTFEYLWGTLGLMLWGTDGAQVLGTPLTSQAPVQRCDWRSLGTCSGSPWEGVLGCVPWLYCGCSSRGLALGHLWESWAHTWGIMSVLGSSL